MADPKEPDDDDDVQLTDEEREALDDSATDPVDEETDEENDGELEAEEAAASPAATAPANDAVPAWQAPDNAAARLEEIKAERLELAKKFDAGEITGVEHLQQLDVLDEERSDLKAALTRETMAQDMRVKFWLDRTVGDFMGEHPEYDGATHPAANALLDRLVREAQVKAGEDGTDPYDPQILADAHAMIRAEFYGETAGAAPAGARAEPAPKPAPLKVTKRAPTPPTLARVPASDMHVTDGGRFAVLDKLAVNDPLAFEEAYAKLPAAERAKYLAAQ